MASIVSAGTTSATALNMSADTSGVLQLASNNGTVALTIDTSQKVTFAYPPTATGGGSVASNTAYGTSALSSNTTGVSSVAIGYEAGKLVVTGNSNTFVGYQAGAVASGSSSENVCLGYRAGYGITTGQYNTFIGTSSGQNGALTGGLNTCIGIWSGAGLTSGSNNTFVGAYGSNGSGSSITSGSKNSILGAYVGNQGGLDIRTASNYIVLSDGDGNPRQTITSAGTRLFNQDGANTSFDGHVSWGNVSSYTFDLTSAFPSGVISSAGLTLQLMVVTQSNTTDTSSYIVMARRTIGGTWAFVTIASSTAGPTITFSGSSNSITLTFSYGAQYGKCNIRGLSAT